VGADGSTGSLPQAAAGQPCQKRLFLAAEICRELWACRSQALQLVSQGK